MKLYEIRCKTCAAAIYRSKGRINENLKFGHNFYCSRRCEYLYKAKRQILTCENSNCARQFTRTPKDISPHNYCSHSCTAQVNNRKFPKRVARAKTCANTSCSKQFRGEVRYCSENCRLAVRPKYTRGNLIKIIKLTTQRLGRVPAKRELQSIADACSWSFGSWNNAITAAGLTPNRSHSQRMYKRVNTRALDGHLCNSISEAIIDNWLMNHKIFHIREVPYPETNHKADWSIRGSVFIEYFGLAEDSPRYDRAVRKKKGLCRKHNIKLIEIYPSDLYPEVRLDNKLKVELSSLGL